MARILIVEDERSILQLVCEVLSEAGHDVFSASNGAEALQRIEEFGTPDLIVLDMWMPVMNGWQLAEALQARGIAVPLVVMTAAREARQRAQEVGAIGFIGKPFDVDQFAETVDRAVQASKPAEDEDGPQTDANSNRVAQQAALGFGGIRLLLQTARDLMRSRPEQPFARAF